MGKNQRTVLRHIFLGHAIQSADLLNWELGTETCGGSPGEPSGGRPGVRGNLARCGRETPCHMTTTVGTAGIKPNLPGQRTGQVVRF